MYIATDRLIIRTFGGSDLPEFEKLLTIPEVPGWQMQQGHAADFLCWHISNYAAMDIVSGIACFGIFERISGHILGAVGAGMHDDLGETEIFYNLLPTARGNGYATEATSAVTNWAFTHAPIPYLIGTVSVENLPSQRVLERIGYQFVDERILTVHIIGEQHAFRYYRYYRQHLA